jgi:hypothetical protein
VPPKERLQAAHEFGFHSQVCEIWTDFGLYRYLGLFELHFIKDLKFSRRLKIMKSSRAGWWLDRWADGWMDGWMDGGWMDGRMDGVWMDGW